jgi:stage V sporulation protein T
MKTGVIRKIDELGRIVLPKEIRKALKVRVGTSIEISINNENSFILKKISGLATVFSSVDQIADMIGDLTNLPCIVSDDDRIACTTKQKTLIGAPLTEKAVEILFNRQITTLEKVDLNELFIIDGLEGIEMLDDKFNVVIAPLINDSSAIGAIYFIIKNEEEKKEAQRAAKFLTKLVETL